MSFTSGGKSTPHCEKGSVRPQNESDRSSTFKSSRSSLKKFHFVEYTRNELYFSFCPLNVLETVTFLCRLVLELSKILDGTIITVFSQKH